MKLSINIENNEFNNNSKGIRNINMPTSLLAQEDVNVNIAGNIVSDNAILIDNILPNIPSDSQELVSELQTELRQLKDEYQRNRKEIDDIITQLTPNMSHSDIIKRVTDGAVFLMQSTLSGIVGNSAYSLLKNIIFPSML